MYFMIKDFVWLKSHGVTPACDICNPFWSWPGSDLLLGPNWTLFLQIEDVKKAFCNSYMAVVHKISTESHRGSWLRSHTNCKLHLQIWCFILKTLFDHFKLFLFDLLMLIKFDLVHFMGGIVLSFCLYCSQVMKKSAAHWRQEEMCASYVLIQFVHISPVKNWRSKRFVSHTEEVNKWPTRE